MRILALTLVVLALSGCVDEEPKFDQNTSQPTETDARAPPAKGSSASPDAPEEVHETNIGGIGAERNQESFTVPEGNWTQLALRLDTLSVMAGALEVTFTGPNDVDYTVYRFAGAQALAGAGSIQTDTAPYLPGEWTLAWSAAGFHQAPATVIVS